MSSCASLIAHCLDSRRRGGFTAIVGLHPGGAPEQGAPRSAAVGDGRGVEDAYRLAPMQQGMLFHALRDTGSGVYVEQLACAIDGPLDEAAFEQAWQQVVARHGVLRTSFHWQGLEEPVQVVHRRVELPFVQEDWRGLSDAEQRARLQAHLLADQQRGFDLERAPLMRLWLARRAEATHELVWSFHHIVADGWSLPLIFKDVLSTYEALRRGEAARFEPVQPYRAYVAWLARQDLAQAESFWRGQLAGFTEPTALGIERRDGAGRQPRGRCAAVCGPDLGAGRGGQAPPADAQHAGAGGVGVAAQSLQRIARRGVRHHGLWPSGGDPRGRGDGRPVHQHAAGARTAPGGRRALAVAGGVAGAAGGGATVRAQPAGVGARLERGAAGPGALRHAGGLRELPDRRGRRGGAARSCGSATCRRWSGPTTGSRRRPCPGESYR